MKYREQLLGTFQCTVYTKGKGRPLFMNLNRYCKILVTQCYCGGSTRVCLVVQKYIYRYTYFTIMASVEYTN